MHLSYITKFVLISLALLMNISCTTMNTKVGGMLNLDTDLKLDFLVGADANSDEQNIPSPLIVRMYELKSADMFNKANFIDIFERDAEVLGADMIDKQQLKHMQPGETREVNFVLSNETQYVGLFAEFLQYKDAKYKLLIPIALTNVFSSSAKIKISGNELSIAEKPAPQTNTYRQSGKMRPKAK